MRRCIGRIGEHRFRSQPRGPRGDFDGNLHRARGPRPYGLFSCPDCGCRMVIFPKGEVRHESVEDGLVVHALSEGFFYALSPTGTP